MPERTLTTAEAAAKLDLTEHQIRRRLHTGVLDGWKEDKRWQITLDSVQRLEDKMWARQQAGKPRTVKRTSNTQR
jgi:hypothetical protein